MPASVFLLSGFRHKVLQAALVSRSNANKLCLKQRVCARLRWQGVLLNLVPHAEDLGKLVQAKPRMRNG